MFRMLAAQKYGLISNKGTPENEGMNMEKGKFRVVIADDEPIIRINLREILHQKGAEVCASVSNGYEAIKACQENHPDVVLLDIKMPICDGISAAKSIHMAQTADTIVMITAYSDISLVEKAADAGISGYLVKPIQEEALLPSIYIARARSQEIRQLSAEKDKARQEVENRKLLERAKGKLMEKNHWSEEKAYQYIRNASKECHVSMGEIARMLLEQMAVLQEPFGK